MAQITKGVMDMNMYDETSPGTPQDDDDGEYFYSKEFVQKFKSLKSFEEAAKFIQDWIKVLKHNATEFANDLPGVLELAC